jgi:hypothetical protein
VALLDIDHDNLRRIKHSFEQAGGYKKAVEAIGAFKRERNIS